MSAVTPILTFPRRGGRDLFRGYLETTCRPLAAQSEIIGINASGRAPGTVGKVA